jgi:hypothetical protein
MTIDSAVNMPTIVTIIIATIGAVAWLIRMEGRVNSSAKDVDDLSKQIGAIDALVMLHHSQFHQYQLEAAEKYMTQAAFGEIKREIVSEINRMEGRLEAQIERVGNKSTSRRTTGQS